MTSLAIRKAAAASAVVAVALSTGGCGAQTDTPDAGSTVKIDPRGPVAAESRQELFSAIDSAGADQFLNALWLPQTLREALPNQTIEYQFNREDAVETFSASSLVVVGTVTKVSPYRGVIYADDDQSKVVDYFDESAGGRSALVTVRVQGSWGEGSPEEVVVKFGSSGMRPQEFLDSLGSFGDVIAVLAKNPDDEYYVPARYGALWGTVTADGLIAFPALGKEMETFMDGMATTSDIDEQYQRSQEPIRLGFAAPSSAD